MDNPEPLEKGWLKTVLADVKASDPEERIAVLRGQIKTLRDALDEIWKYAAHGTAAKQKDARVRIFVTIHDLALTALAATAPVKDTPKPAKPWGFSEYLQVLPEDKSKKEGQ